MRETIFLFSVASFISGISLRVVEPMLPRLATDFGVSVSVAATVIAAYAVTYACSPFACGPLGDRYGRSPVVTITSSPLRIFCMAFDSYIPDLGDLRRAGWEGKDPTPSSRPDVSSTRLLQNLGC